MNRRVTAALGGTVVALLVVGGCKSDPTSSLDATPKAIITTFSLLNMTVGKDTAFIASVVNAQGFGLEIPVRFSACATGGAFTGAVTAVGDPAYTPPVPSKFRALVHAVSVGKACAIASGGGLVDSVLVTVTP
jgi:hypothetical protein